MKAPPQLTIAQRHAHEATIEANGEYAVVLIARGDALVVGAYCPGIDVIKHLLRDALRQMDTGEAIQVTTLGDPS